MDAAELDEQERERWCRAWRLLQKHGDDVFAVLDAEIHRAAQAGEPELAADLRSLSLAVEELSR